MSMGTNRVRRKTGIQSNQTFKCDVGVPYESGIAHLYRDTLIDLMCRYPLLIPEAVELLMRSPQLQQAATRRTEPQGMGPKKVRRGRPKGSKNKPKN